MLDVAALTCARVVNDDSHIVVSDTDRGVRRGM
jgi:hypothetical protein